MIAPWQAGAALAILALLSAAIVRIMIRHGVMDVPGARSSHDRPTPKGGGVGIAVAWGTGLAAAWAAGLVPGQSAHVAALLTAGSLVAAISWADDVGQFGFRTKLAAQIAAAVILVSSGLTIDRVGHIPLGPLSAPVTIAWLLFATNATNFIDGLNGLASGCTLIAGVAVSAAALGAGDPLPAAALLPLAAGIVGFLPFNYPTARIFMGDVGSQLCGLSLAAMAAPCSRLPGHSWGATLVPLAIAPILADVGFTLLRRWRAGDRLTEAHRGHLYQLARRSGWSAARVTLAFWLLTAICAACAAPAARGSAAAFLLAAAAVAVGGVSVLTAARKAPIGRW
jgi:UDP-GlcNAc:undecaprenyl-phosphate GlcNAc-1-phosphate transferase